MRDEKDFHAVEATKRSRVGQRFEATKAEGDEASERVSLLLRERERDTHNLKIDQNQYANSWNGPVLIQHMVA